MEIVQLRRELESIKYANGVGNLFYIVINSNSENQFESTASDEGDDDDGNYWTNRSIAFDAFDNVQEEKVRLEMEGSSAN